MSGQYSPQTVTGFQGQTEQLGNANVSSNDLLIFVCSSVLSGAIIRVVHKTAA